MEQLCEAVSSRFPVTIYYAFKQSETKGDIGVTASTGWETFLEAVMRSGFSVTGTWPIRTENTTRLIGMAPTPSPPASSSSAAVAPSNAPLATRREFLTALRSELPAALAVMRSGNIAPVDLAQAAIGPGMAVYTRYGRFFAWCIPLGGLIERTRTDRISSRWRMAA